MQICFPLYPQSALIPYYTTMWQSILQSMPERLAQSLPDTLSFGAQPSELLDDPMTVLSQCSGWNLTQSAKKNPLLTPQYAIAGCEAAQYSSVFVCREQDKITDLKSAAEKRGCYTNRQSLSSYHQAQRAFDSQGIEHRLNLAIACESVEKGLALINASRADYMAVDCIYWHYLSLEAEGLAKGLRVFAQTPNTLAPAFFSNAPTRVQQALRESMLALDLEKPWAKALAIQGFSTTTRNQYTELNQS